MQVNRAVSKVIKAVQTSDGAGVSLKRSIGSHKLDHFDPFLLLDEFKSDDPEDYIEGFPDHPHRGFETVTYQLAGEMEHRDHKGNHGVLSAGSVQWMTAGRGIVHSEMPRQKDGLMWGFQLWVNLPAAKKLCAPRYQDIPAHHIPELHFRTSATQPGMVAVPPGSDQEDVKVRLVAGQFGGSEGAVKDIVTKPLYLDVILSCPSSFFTCPIPVGHNVFCYVYEGSLLVADGNKEVEVQQGNLVVFDNTGKEEDGSAVSVKKAVTGDNPSKVLVVAGKPLNEPIARMGPFVMNTFQEIQQAFKDFHSGKLEA